MFNTILYDIMHLEYMPTTFHVCYHVELNSNDTKTQSSIWPELQSWHGVRPDPFIVDQRRITVAIFRLHSAAVPWLYIRGCQLAIVLLLKIIIEFM